MSKGLIALYAIAHQNPKRFPGFSVKLHVSRIGELVRSTASESLLDYGCGKGYQYLARRWHEEWGILPLCYDPAVKWLNHKPKGQFDGLICTDVMEHLEEDEVDTILAEIFGYARKFVFLSICTVEATKSLPDGRNCHLTVRPRVWWEKMIESHRRGFGGETIIVYDDKTHLEET